MMLLNFIFLIFGFFLNLHSNNNPRNNTGKGKNLKIYNIKKNDLGLKPFQKYRRDNLTNKYKFSQNR